MPLQLKNGQPIADAWGINLKEGGGVSLIASYDAAEQKVDWTVTATGVAANILTNDRTIKDSTFAGPPAAGASGVITYASTVHAYNFAIRIASGVWIHLRRGVHGRDYGAKFDQTADDATALQACFDETTGGLWGLSGQSVWMPAGQALVGTTLVPSQQGGFVIRGEGDLATKLMLADTLNAPILDNSAGTTTAFFIRDICFDARTKAGHTTTFPLVEMSSNDTGGMQNVRFQNSPGDGYWHLGKSDVPIVAADTRNYRIHTGGNYGIGIKHQYATKHFYFGGISAQNGKSGIVMQGLTDRAFSKNGIFGYSTELNGTAGGGGPGIGYGVEVRSNVNQSIHDHYSDNEPSFYIHDDCYATSILDSTLIGNTLTGGSAPPTKHMSVLYNGGHFTDVANIDGIYNPID